MAESDERYHQRRRRRRVGWAVAVVLVAAITVDRLLHADQVAGFFATETVGRAGQAVWAGWKGTVLNPWYVGLVVVLVVAERFLFAERGSGTLTRGGVTDLFWVVAFPLTSVTVVALWLAALDAVYLHELGGVIVDLPEAIGWVPAVVVAFLIGDFFQWFTHLVRHKVPTFWHFHAVHHSQPQMGVLTDYRVHFVEAMIAGTLVFVPSVLLGLGGEVSFLLALGTTYFTAFTHANLRTNLGPLRWLLITPQFHRVHHSYAPEHIDTNYGAVLSVWDRVFRTAYLGEDEYPITGIEDPDFPLEQRTGQGVVRTYLRQLAYPFRQCAADIARYDLGRRPVAQDG